jgi:hypothetical protein
MEPLNIHNVGLYFRDLFDENFDYYQELKNVHQFQRLTESNKPGTSFRKGIYLSNVNEESNGNKIFNLLRCSTNLGGSTEIFKKIDVEILKTVNTVRENYFKDSAPFNHVLAQIYENSTVKDEISIKEKKARIKQHSDKTKDMPSNSLIAFCTFYSKDLYNNDIKKSKEDPFDYIYKNGSVLTKLRFKLKKFVIDREPKTNLVRDFSITLYPNSGFIIPLSTNRLYTHEIVPSKLQVNKIPTRLGYVIRSSNTVAVHKNGNTYIRDSDTEDLIELHKPSTEEMIELKKLYQEENMTDNNVKYGKTFFSLNNGDYQKPTM